VVFGGVMGLVVVGRGRAVVDGPAVGPAVVAEGRGGEVTTVGVGSSTAPEEVSAVGSGATSGLVSDGSAAGPATVFGWADTDAQPKAPTIRPVATADMAVSPRVSDDTVRMPLSRSCGPTMYTSITTGRRIEPGAGSRLGKKSRIWLSIGGDGGQDIA
jgi:hypothetical protein